MPSYAYDRQWSDRFIPEIKRIVGPHLLEAADLELDAKEATDLIVFRARDMRIAARIRRAGYAERYPFDITIRAHRDSGSKTELSKIIDGFGDWFFYGHADASEDRIGLWWLIDLHHFRAALIRASRNNGASLQCGDKSNGDGTYFKWFDLRSFPRSPPILVAASVPLYEPGTNTVDESLPLFSN
jgi:hypothetical protein